MKTNRRVAGVIDKQASEAWAQGARSKPCAVCGSTGIIEGHHIVYKQQLRKVADATGLSYDRLCWDARNRLSLCPRHHAAHHSAAHRVSLAIVQANAPKLMQFVRELDRAHDGREPVASFVERTYPGVPVERDREAAA